jgi:hypothetical protein
MESVFIFYYDTKEKEHQNTLGNLINTRGLRPSRTNQIASCFDAKSSAKIRHNQVYNM